MQLEFLWYLVIGFSLIAYTVLDGFDLGVGILHPFAKTDMERRTFLNAIGPVWDGNEVWLVVLGGALFAGFPEVYATVFSGFYNLLMVLIAGLIFRAAAIEFRSQKPSPAWRTTWDMVFAAASLAITFIVGVSLGNFVMGVPLDSNHILQPELFNPFQPYALLVGVMSVALFTMHGAIFLVMKTEGKLQEKLRRWTNHAILFFICTYLMTTWATLAYMPHMLRMMRKEPYLVGIALLAFLSILNIPREMHKGREGRAFLFSCAGIALLIIIFGMGTYPVLVRSSIHPDIYSLTISNAASSALTLKVLMIIVAIGVPLVIAYGAWIYRIFRGKVKIISTSY